jgi:serine/threonine protein kinase
MEYRFITPNLSPSLSEWVRPTVPHETKEAKSTADPTSEESVIQKIKEFAIQNQHLFTSTQQIIATRIKMPDSDGQTMIWKGPDPHDLIAFPRVFIGSGSESCIEQAVNLSTNTSLAIVIPRRNRIPSMLYPSLNNILSRSPYRFYLQFNNHRGLVKSHKVLDLAPFIGPNLPDYPIRPGILQTRYDGDLNKYWNWDKLCDSLKLKLCTDLIVGLAALHNSNLVHRDIKPANILYLLDKTTNQPRELAICDFGCVTASNEINELLESKFTHAFAAPEHWNEKLPDNAPEIFQRYLRMDMWALGCVIHEIHFNKGPYFTYDESDWLIQQLGQPGKYYENFEKWRRSLDTRNPLLFLVQSMLDINPTTRMTIISALAYTERLSKRNAEQG